MEMKWLIVFFSLLVGNEIYTQKHSAFGLWKGESEFGQTIQLEIKKEDVGCRAVMSLPLQGIKNVVSKRCALDLDTIIIEYRIQSKEVLILVPYEDKLVGYWKQNGNRFKIDFERTESFTRNRPQEPKPPFEYYLEEVRFFNDIDSINLEGILTLPDSLERNCPVALLIGGSGRQNRDADLLDHKFFLVIADYLAKNGIGSLRYDERGVGESEGSFMTATSVDFKKDVLSGIKYLDELGFNSLGLIGHSEGGMIAPMAAVESDKIDFVITLAGPGIAISELMTIQNKNILESQGIFDSTEIQSYVSFLDIAYSLVDLDTKKDELYEPMKEHCYNFYESKDTNIQKLYGVSKEVFYVNSASAYFQPWLRYFINYDPGPILEKISCPFLALNGNFDIQVSAEENLNGFDLHLSKSKSPKYETLELDSINHLFQKANSWHTSEYIEIEETFNKKVLALIVEWILAI